MAGSYSKKLSTKSPSLGASPGRGKFQRVSAPKLAPLKTKTYTKEAMRQDPTEFGGVGFGDTGLHETPSLLGMGKRGLKL